MPIKILMPALSPTMEKGNLAKWTVKEGDTVKSGDVIAEIETDKATMEVEAVDEGVVARILVPAGSQDVAVNEVIAILAGEGEDVAAASAAGAVPPHPPRRARHPLPQGERVSLHGRQSRAGDAGRRRIWRRGARAGGGSAERTGQGRGRADLRLAARPARRQGQGARPFGADRVGAAWSHHPAGRREGRAGCEARSGGDCGSCSGPCRSGGSAPKPALATGPSDEMTLKLFEPGSYDVIPHDGMRKTIARRLTESKQTVPHFYLTVDIELDALLTLRSQLNDAAPTVDGKPIYKLSVNDLVVKAYALALKSVPDANVSWTDGGMLRHKVVDVGVAVSIPGGLITPIIRKADAKPVSQISNEIKDLAKRAKDRKLKPRSIRAARHRSPTSACSG